MNSITKRVRTTRYNKHGIPDEFLWYKMCNEFYFDKTYIDCLKNYYVLQWKPEYCLRAILNGTIYHQDIHYQVIFHRTTAKLVQNAILTQPESHVKVSFRNPHSEFNVPAVVLVKLYRQTLLI